MKTYTVRLADGSEFDVGARTQAECRASVQTEIKAGRLFHARIVSIKRKIMHPAPDKRLAEYASLPSDQLMERLDVTVNMPAMGLLAQSDDRTPLQLVTDGDCRWPERDRERRIYLPPHLTGRARRQFLRELLTLELEDSTRAAQMRYEFARASGDCVCPQCGEVFYEHPADPHEPSLTILCDRSRVKL